MLVLDFPDVVFDEPAFALVPVLPEEEPVLPDALRLEEEEEPEDLSPDMLLGFPVLPAVLFCAPPDIMEAEEAAMLLPG